jgi:hypothetical protein
MPGSMRVLLSNFSQYLSLQTQYSRSIIDLLPRRLPNHSLAHQRLHSKQPAVPLGPADLPAQGHQTGAAPGAVPQLSVAGPVDQAYGGRTSTLHAGSSG